jgi:predicted nucleotidyltransferase
MNKNKPADLEKYPDIRALLDEILLRIQGILNKKLIGLYLYGSLVAGDFNYEVSDIDLLAATASVIDENEFAALEKMHDGLIKKFPNWENRIEIQYVSLEALRTFKTEKSKIANISPGEEFHFLDAGRDWLLNWHFVRESGVTLYGKMPEEIIPKISKTEFVETAREQAFERLERIEISKHSRPFQAYLIMTVCRAFYTVETGAQASKKQAADYVKKKFPQFSNIIENAFKWREKHRGKNVNPEAIFPATKEFIIYIIQRIKS